MIRVVVEQTAQSLHTPLRVNRASEVLLLADWIELELSRIRHHRTRTQRADGTDPRGPSPIAYPEQSRRSVRNDSHQGCTHSPARMPISMPPIPDVSSQRDARSRTRLGVCPSGPAQL